MMNVFDNYECEGQISLFDGFLKERCDTKPAIGTKLIFHYNDKDYECEVENHCGHDFFYVKFTRNTPNEDDPDIEDTKGWHLSLRGYGKDWDYANST